MKTYKGPIGNAPMKYCPFTKELCKYVYLTPEDVHFCKGDPKNPYPQRTDMLKECPQEGKKK